MSGPRSIPEVILTVLSAFGLAYAMVSAEQAGAPWPRYVMLVGVMCLAGALLWEIRA